jgi:hypothetical protein
LPGDIGTWQRDELFVDADAKVILVPEVSRMEYDPANASHCNLSSGLHLLPLDRETQDRIAFVLSGIGQRL